MVGEYRKHKLFSGFLYGVSMLLIYLANCTDSKPQAKVLIQTKKLVEGMLQKANDLFYDSVKEHDIPMSDCGDTLTWFPKPNISYLPKTQLLNAINQNLIYFIKAFEVLLEPNRHTIELHHTSKLQEARKNIKALRSNIISLLSMENDTEKIDSKLRHSQSKLEDKQDLKVPNTRSIYEEKLECCTLLNIYKDFLQDVNKVLKKSLKRTIRSGIHAPQAEAKHFNSLAK